MSELELRAWAQRYDVTEHELIMLKLRLELEAYRRGFERCGREDLCLACRSIDCLVHSPTQLFHSYSTIESSYH